MSTPTLVNVWNPRTLTFEPVAPAPPVTVKLLSVLQHKGAPALVRGCVQRPAIARRPLSWPEAQGVQATEEAAVKTHGSYRWEPVDPGR
jgi:hypothetical protein